MDRSIPGGDLIGRWSLSFADIDFVNSKPALTRLGLAAQLKFCASLGLFAIDPGSIPTDGLSYLAEQLGVEADRRSVVEGKSGSVGVDIGGSRSIKKKKEKEKQ